MSNDNNKWQKFKEATAVDQDAPVAESYQDEADSAPQMEIDQETPAATPGLEHPSYAVLEEKLTLAEQQSHDYWEKLTRLSAELDNVRRRAEKDVTAAHQYGTEKLIKGLLPVLDSLDQAVLLVDQTAHSAMYDGLHLTQKLFVDTLAKHGVELIDPQGLPFNPQEHEAMSMQVSETQAPNTVMIVFQKGYRLHGRVMRAAKVIVAKANAE